MLSLERWGEGVLRICADGQLGTDDYIDFVTRFEWFADGRSKPFSILIELGPNFGGWSIDALFRDLDFNLRRQGAVRCIAVIADGRWKDWASGGSYAPLAKEIRFFEAAEMAAARLWLLDCAGGELA